MVTALNVETHQSLTLTRQTIQSIELLAMPAEALEAYLLEQCERNPLLQVEPPLPVWKTSMPAFASRTSTDIGSLAETARVRLTLREYLHQQLAACRTDRKTLDLAAYIIDSLEPDGFLRTDLGQLAELLQLPVAQLEAALSIVQGLEPTGVGARNLVECFRIQLLEQERLDSLYKTILDNFHLVAGGDIEQLVRICRYPKETVVERIRNLRNLDSSPGLSLELEPLPVVVPDIVVSFPRGKEFAVQLNEHVLPRLSIDRDYFAAVYGNTDHQGRRFIKSCMDEAQLLVRQLRQRSETILRIATEIVRRQKDAIRFGPSHLKPLTQQQVARAIGIHESTVSRAVADRWLICPRGLMSLKDLFTHGVGGDEDAVAAERIRQMIQQLIATETPSKVYSDDALAAHLAQKGIHVARRTVAKYRSQLNIATASVRKRALRFR